MYPAIAAFIGRNEIRSDLIEAANGLVERQRITMQANTAYMKKYSGDKIKNKGFLNQERAERNMVLLTRFKRFVEKLDA